jgi:hypothetical protein
VVVEEGRTHIAILLLSFVEEPHYGDCHLMFQEFEI